MTRDTDQAPTHRLLFTKAMLRDALRTFIWRSGVVDEKGLWVAMTGLSGLLAWLVWRGDRSWLAGLLVGLLAASLCVVPALLAAVWALRRRATLRRYRSMRDPSVTVMIRPDGLAMASELGSGQVPWERVTEVWRRPGSWMLFTGPAQYSALPLDGLPPAELERLRALLGPVPFR